MTMDSVQKCPQCRHGRLVEIELTLADRQVVMRSCSECDTRWWDAEGRSSGLSEVLALASSGKR